MNYGGDIMSEKELLAGRIETINKCFEQLVDTFNNFFQGVEIDETHTESFKEVQDQMKQFADDISTVQKQWVDYQLYLIDTANSMILDVPIVNRTHLMVDHQEGIVRILTEYKIDAIITDILPIHLFRDIILCTVEQFASGRRNIKVSDITKLMEDEIRSRSGYDEAPRLLVYRVFNVLKHHDILIPSSTVRFGHNLNKSVAEVKQWLDHVLSQNR